MSYLLYIFPICLFSLLFLLFFSQKGRPHQTPRSPPFLGQVVHAHTRHPGLWSTAYLRRWQSTPLIKGAHHPSPPQSRCAANGSIDTVQTPCPSTTAAEAAATPYIMASVADSMFTGASLKAYMQPLGGAGSGEYPVFYAVGRHHGPCGGVYHPGRFGHTIGYHYVFTYGLPLCAQPAV